MATPNTGLTNITVAVPSPAVNALQRSTNPSETAEAIATITRAVVDNLSRPSSNVPVEDNRDDTASILSFDSDKAASSSESCLGVYGPRELNSVRAVQIFVVDLTGKTNAYSVAESATVLQLQRAIERCDGPPASHQRLLFGGKQLEAGRALETVRQ